MAVKLTVIKNNPLPLYCISLYTLKMGDIMEQLLNIPNCSYAKVFKIAKDEIERIDFAMCNEPSETIDSYYKRQNRKPEIISNGGFFDMYTGNTIFSYVDNGDILSLDGNHIEGFGVRGTDLILDIYNTGYLDFISAYPVLLKDGQKVVTNVASEINYRARRTFIGFNDDYIFLGGIDSPGMNFTELRDFLLSIGVKTAINLDGGGSTRILHNGKLVTYPTSYNRPVDNVVAIYLKKIVYRVQLGAFSSRINAENFANVIRTVDDTINAGYRNAYVRLIDGYYKVQVGAFSVKANADRVLNDLKGKGYNAFITTK